MKIKINHFCQLAFSVLSVFNKCNRNVENISWKSLILSIFNYFSLLGQQDLQTLALWWYVGMEIQDDNRNWIYESFKVSREEATLISYTGADQITGFDAHMISYQHTGNLWCHCTAALATAWCLTGSRHWSFPVTEL